MTRTKGAMRWGAVFAAVSSGLCGLGLILSGFGDAGLGLVPYGVVFAAIAYGLMQRMRWVAYLGFLALFVGLIMAVSNVYAIGAVPGWLYAGLAVATLLGVVSLFAALWKSPEIAAP